jgi:hypothetical protein
MDEEKFELEMRLEAMEYFLCKAYLSLALSQGINPEHFDTFAKDFVASAAKQQFPAKDPALSDLYSAGWEFSVARLIDLQKKLLGQIYPTRPGAQRL